MTDQLIMTTEQRQELLANEPLSSAAVLMLDSLPMVSAEPVATVKSWTNGSYWRNYKIDWNKDVPEGTKLYTSPQALTPITADALKELHHIDEFGLFYSFEEFEQIARAIEQKHGIVNHKGEA